MLHRRSILLSQRASTVYATVESVFYTALTYYRSTNPAKENGSNFLGISPFLRSMSSYMPLNAPDEVFWRNAAGIELVGWVRDAQELRAVRLARRASRGRRRTVCLAVLARRSGRRAPQRRWHGVGRRSTSPTWPGGLPRWMGGRAGCRSGAARRGRGWSPRSAPRSPRGRPGTRRGR